MVWCWSLILCRLLWIWIDFQYIFVHSENKHGFYIMYWETLAIDNSLDNGLSEESSDWHSLVCATFAISRKTYWPSTHGILSIWLAWRFCGYAERNLTHSFTWPDAGAISIHQAVCGQILQLVLRTRYCGSLYRPTTVCDKKGFSVAGWLDYRLPFPQSAVQDSGQAVVGVRLWDDFASSPVSGPSNTLEVDFVKTLLYFVPRSGGGKVNLLLSDRTLFDHSIAPIPAMSVECLKNWSLRTWVEVKLWMSVSIPNITSWQCLF